MPTPGERHRNNIRTGVFVSFTIVLGFAVIVAITGVGAKLFAQHDAYSVRFDIATGVSNLKSGADVRVGGIVRGYVEQIRLVDSPDDDEPAIVVDFTLDEEIDLHGDATIFVQSPLIGSGAWLSIPSVGTPDAAMPEGGVLRGGTTGGMLGAMLGPDGAADMKRIIANVRDLTDFAADVPERYGEDIDVIVSNVRDTSESVRTVSADIQEEAWPRWSTRITEALDWSEDFRAGLDGTVADVRGAVGSARETIDENRPGIREIVENTSTASDDVRSVLERIDTETMDQLTAFLEDSNTAVEEARELVTSINTDYGGWSQGIGGTLANAELASQQLKLALVEIRRSPWRVLYRPKEAEVERELLYEAARSFALASAELRGAADTTRRLLERHGDVLGDDPELVDRVRSNLLEPMDRYEAAQKRLLDILFADAGP